MKSVSPRVVYKVRRCMDKRIGYGQFCGNRGSVGRVSVFGLR